MISIIGIEAARYRWRAINIQLRNDNTLKCESVGCSILPGCMEKGHFTPEFRDKLVRMCCAGAAKIGGATSYDAQRFAKHLANF